MTFRAHGRRALRLLLVLAPAVCTVCAAERVVRAQPAAPSASDLETARALFKQGKDKRAAGDLRGARDTLKAANALGQTPITALELARTHELLHELVEAREAALSVARMALQGDETERSAAARADAAKLADALKPRIPTVLLHVTAVNAAPNERVTVVVDGVALPPEAAGQGLKVNPGHHGFTATAEGRGEVRGAVDLAEGETRELTLALQARASDPGRVATGDTAATPPRTSRESPLRAFIPLGLVTVGVGVLAGTATGITAMNRAAELRDACGGYQCTPRHHDDLASANTTATLSTVSFGVAVLGAGMVVIGLLSPKGERSPVGRAVAYVAPFVGAGEAGVRGAF